MKLKMSKNSLFAILLRSPWWVSWLLVAVITLASAALLPEGYVAFGVMGGFPFLVIGVMAAFKQWRAPNPTRVAEALAQAGAMSWRDFSGRMEDMFAQQGYAVSPVKHPAADFQLVKAGTSTLVSCKRWKAANHGVEALRDLVAAKETQGAQHCTYVSLGPVSDTAKRFAASQGVTLLSGAELGRFLVEKPAH